VAERSAVDELNLLLDDAREVFADPARFVISAEELRASAQRRTRALEPGLPRFRHRINRGLFSSVSASLVGLFRTLCEDAGLDRTSAAAIIDEVLQTAYRKRLAAPIKGKLMGGVFRLPVLRNAILRKLEQAREDPGGFVMNKVDSPGDLMAFDVEYCPISRYFAEQDATEIGPLVCKIDDLLADTMPGITLQRTGTIANGAQRCDFRYRLER
jgi:hypothetical protein